MRGMTWLSSNTIHRKGQIPRGSQGADWRWPWERTLFWFFGAVEEFDQHLSLRKGFLCVIKSSPRWSWDTREKVIQRKPFLYLEIMFYFLFFLGSSGVWTQGLKPVRQVLHVLLSRHYWQRQQSLCLCFDASIQKQVGPEQFSSRDRWTCWCPDRKERQ
jgi:hypothetical protein